LVARKGTGNGVFCNRAKSSDCAQDGTGILGAKSRGEADHSCPEVARWLVVRGQL
jgi:hypothetical protein